MANITEDCEYMSMDEGNNLWWHYFGSKDEGRQIRITAKLGVPSPLVQRAYVRFCSRGHHCGVYRPGPCVCLSPILSAPPGGWACFRFTLSSWHMAHAKDSSLLEQWGKTAWSRRRLGQFGGTSIECIGTMGRNGGLEA